MVADSGRVSDGPSGEPESPPPLWRKLWRMFEGDGDQTLRAQIEVAIREHASRENAGSDESGVPSGKDLSPIERKMLTNLLHFGDRDADHVAIPRGEIVALPSTASWGELVAAFAEHGHSRLPVYRETLDEIIGMMLIKDVFPFLAKGQPPADWTTLLRQPLFVPQARGALDVLADMRSSRVHLAVVVDEYSGTDGIVTFEDLVEEIIGEIEDEHDDAATDMLRPLADGVWEADARVPLAEVGERIDPRLAEVEEAVDTLGGLAAVLAEQVPPVGTMLLHSSGWCIEIIGADERHVTQLRLHPPAPAVPAPPTKGA